VLKNIICSNRVQKGESGGPGSLKNPNISKQNHVKTVWKGGRSNSYSTRELVGKNLTRSLGIRTNREGNTKKENNNNETPSFKKPQKLRKDPQIPVL